MSVLRKALSYASGPSARPMRGATIGGVFDATAALRPNHLALVSRHDGVRWTYAEFQQNVDKCAAGLLKLGLKRGDNIAVWALNGSQWATVQFAAAKAGLGLLKANPAYRSTEIAYALNKVRDAAIVCAWWIRWQPASSYNALASVVRRCNSQAMIRQCTPCQRSPLLPYTDFLPLYAPFSCPPLRGRSAARRF